MHPNKRNFKGELYVLVNGGCLSTTGHLISLLKFNTKAVFMGEEPGSTFRCNDMSIQFTLPCTGIEVNVPTTTFETAVKGISLFEPLQVDYPINIAIVDITDSENAYLKRALMKVMEFNDRFYAFKGIY